MEGPFAGEIPSGEKQVFLIMAVLPQWRPNRCSEGLMGYQPQGSTGAKASWVYVTQNRGAVGPIRLGERIRVQFWTVGQRLLVRWVLLSNDQRQGQWGHVLTNTIYYIWKGLAVKFPWIGCCRPLVLNSFMVLHTSWVVFKFSCSIITFKNCAGGSCFRVSLS